VSCIKTEALERSSYIATIIAAIAAIGALGFGYWQFLDTQRAQRETLALDREVKAIDLTLKFIDLKTDVATQAARADRRDQQRLVIAESIFDLGGDNKGWRETAKWMVEEEAQYIKNYHLGCQSFNPKFIGFVKQTITAPNICDDP
jgi:hypothetical protein